MNYIKILQKYKYKMRLQKNNKNILMNMKIFKISKEISIIKEQIQCKYYNKKIQIFKNKMKYIKVLKKLNLKKKILINTKNKTILNNQN